MATKAAMAKIVAGVLLAIVDPTPTDLTILLSNALTPALNWSEGVLRFEQEKDNNIVLVDFLAKMREKPCGLNSSSHQCPLSCRQM